VSRDWHEWHRKYDDAASSLSRRLAEVRRQLGADLDARAAAGQRSVRLLSLCAGDGRDTIPVLAARPGLDVDACLVELDPTPDILAEVGEKKGDRLLVGFAAETENLVEEARRKMLSKHCDMLVANLVNREGLGFEADNNEVEIITQGGKTAHAGPAGKRQIAEQILDQIALLRLTLRAVDASA